MILFLLVIFDRKKHQFPSHCHFPTTVLPGVAHSTSEKQKPGPLDLALLFREVVDVKKVSVLTSTRELLFSSIAEYNKSVSNKVGGYVKKVAFKIIHNLYLKLLFSN